jgi:putative sigma-54 modulation protein
MISHIDISGIHYEVSEDLKRYVTKKIGKLDRLAPRHARKTLYAEVRLTERKTKSDRNQCEITLHLPEQQLTAKEATINMFAAVDIVETKLKNQLKKYKELHSTKKLARHGLLRKFLRSNREA